MKSQWAMTVGKWLLLLTSMSVLPGCVGLVVMGAQQIASPGAEEEERLQRQVVDGTTLKAELIEKLGEPLHEMNGGNVLVFGGRQRGRNLVQMFSEDKREEHRLIAVFDQSGVLRDHLWVGRKRGGKKAVVLQEPSPAPAN